MIDENGTFLYASRIVAGLKEEDVIGASVYSFVTPESVETVKASLRECLATNKMVTYEIAGPGPNQTTATYLCRMSPSVVNQKRVLLCISTDVTKYKELENDLRAKITELEKLMHAMTNRELKMTELKKEIEELKEHTE